MKPSFDLMRASSDPDISKLPSTIMGLWDNLAYAHEQIESATPDVDALEASIAELQGQMQTFFTAKMLPLRATEKYYDHALTKHVVPQMRALAAEGMSLAAVSSKFLEALNKTVKKALRRLPGGGRAGKKTQDVYARLPIVQGFKKVVAACKVQRTKLYKSGGITVTAARQLKRARQGVN